MGIAIAHCDLVSIHASVMEATGHPLRPPGRQGVSIHASVMEATPAAPGHCRPPGCFDPRLRDGGDFPPFNSHCTCFQFRSTPP